MAGPSMTQRISSIPWAGPRLMLRLHRAGFGFSTVTWSEFADRVERDRPDAVTVDVFETCVVRDLAGDRAIEEAASRRVAGPTLVANAPADAADQAFHATHAEAAAELELDLCRPVPDAVESLDRIRSVVDRIVFISDTDRSSDLLIELLERHDLFRDGDRLVASCEHGVTKSAGGLYNLIWDTRPETVWHLGNNNWADGVMAAAHGYEPFDISSGNLTRYEAALCRDPSSLGPVLAGAARSARLQLEYERERGKLDDRTFHLNRLGAQVAGPVMVTFALWIADQVREHGIDHLGFLARDGELPQMIANRVPDPALQGTGQSYVQLNRMAVTLATAPAVGVDAWVKEGTQDRNDFLRARMHLISFGGLLQRVGFDHADVKSVMGPSFPLTGHDPEQSLEDAQADEWLELLGSQSAQELILNRATERRAVIVDYLGQLGLLSSAQPAFVDVGWRGRMARLINTALLEYFSNEPVHLHFGGDKLPPGLDDMVRIHRFAFPGTTPIEPFEAPPFPVETITASGNPRVVDYVRTETGGVEPVLQPAPTDVGQADRIEMWQGALAMVERLPTDARISSWGLHGSALDEEAREILRLWWYQPDRDEALAMSAFGFEGDEAGVQVYPVAAPYVLTDIIGSNRRPRQWRQGSGAVSSFPARVGLELAMLARRLRR